MPSRNPSDDREEVRMASSSHQGSAWATLVTGEKYLPGVGVFAESLLGGSQHHKGSNYPLIAMVTSDVGEEALAALTSLGCVIRPVKRLHPGHSKGDKNMAFAHFGDVWTKLRAFDLTEYERVVMVDSDMLVRKNMDELFDDSLEEGHIKAAFACTCNPAKNPNYPKEWIPANCAYTQQRHPEHTLIGMTISEESPPTHHSLNSGLVVLRPSHEVMNQMERQIQNDPVVENYRFPDQDFLADFYRGRFTPISYIYNGLKKLRASHQNLWRDDEVKNVHYIINKPWTAQLKAGDSDEVTHQWWWDAYRLRSWPAVVVKYVQDAEPSAKASNEEEPKQEFSGASSSTGSDSPSDLMETSAYNSLYSSNTSIETNEVEKES
ncbi:hypothetical protein CBS101457_002406 [Exobasidium rhododendri]|nr:hypothetical protein CBS101457_002406 [Exobasidium rhododendri]